ncbi:IGR protein motif-domain-containing protein [Aspergillus karnatakaensis]|uniref:mitochondrial 37S ribosomal protein mS41 n=1 Tax=Aspergillus karnatakaensis TaxID=1810916 RepID=UPI003CCE0195
MAMHHPYSITRAIKSFQIPRQHIRAIHKTSSPLISVPKPTPFIPDVKTFLTVIGRDMTKFESKIPSWEKLFTSSSTELREAGVEPAKLRRYLLRHRERFRKGIYGPGGDLDIVVDGVAQLRVVEVPAGVSESVEPITRREPDPKRRLRYSASLTPGMRRVIVNLPPDATDYTYDPSKPLKKYQGVKIFDTVKVKGRFLNPIKKSKGTAALIKVTPNMWADRPGRKVDGGERRQAEVRAKKRADERRKAA